MLAVVSQSTARRAVLLTLATLLGLVAITVIAYFLTKKWRKKRAEGGIDNVLRPIKFGFAPLEGVAGDAKATDIGGKVASNVQQLKERGVNPSARPWYLMMGYPSSGKTWACWALTKKIPTPRGMARPFVDPNQHSGTGNLDFWFYNDATILDTAGRVVFQETPEWKVMLDNIRRARPDHPINGVFLVVGSDELMNESAKVLTERAEHLRDQLDSVKLKLGVRFPVYLLVTKADLLPGFKEFFAALPDEKRDQIMGWSTESQNLDEPVIAGKTKAGQVSDSDTTARRPDGSRARFLEALTGPVKRWRSGILSTNEQGDQLNAVDQCYGFPAELAERFGKVYDIYLQTIFGDEVESIYDEHRTRNRLFLRGVYFCSARQGLAPAPIAEDSTEMAPVRNDPEPERRIYFLKTLLESKIFPEQHLVVADDNIGKRRKKFLLISAAAPFAAFLILLILAVILQSGLERGVSDEVALWKQAINASRWAGGVGSPELASLIDVHSKLSARVTTNFSVPFVFRPMKLAPISNVDSERRSAQRKLFETQVIRPMLEACRDRLKAGDTSPMTADRLGALGGLVSALIEIEAGQYGPDRESLRRGQAWLTNALVFLSVPDGARENLIRLFDSNYDQSRNAGARDWPGDGFSEGLERLEENSALKRGIEWYLRAVQEMNTNTAFAQRRAEALSGKAQALRSAEQDFYRSLGPGSQISTAARFDALIKAKAEVFELSRDSLLQGLLSNGLFEAQSGAFAQLRDRAIKGSRGRIQELIDRVPKHGRKALFSEVTDFLTKATLPGASMGGMVEQRDPQLDEGWLASDGSGSPYYLVRLSLLEKLATNKFIFLPGEKFSTFLSWRDQWIDAWKNATTQTAREYLGEALKAAFSQWESGVAKRWDREYVLRSQNATAGVTALVAELQKAGLNSSGIPAREMGTNAMRIVDWAETSDGLGIDLRDKTTRFSSTRLEMQTFDAFTAKAAGELEELGKKRETTVSEAYVFSLASAAARKMIFPFGVGSASVNPDAIVKEVATLKTGMELAARIATNADATANLAITPQRTNYVAECLARARGVAALVDENGAVRKGKFSLVKGGSVDSKWSDIYIDDGTHAKSVVGLRFRGRSPEVNLDLAADLKLSGAIVGKPGAVPEVFFTSQSWGILRLIQGSRVLGSTTNATSFEYTIPDKGTLRFNVELPGLEQWVKVIEKSKVETR